MSNRLAAIGALLAALAVALGAFGAHALEARLAPEAARWYATANAYHFYHALGLLAIGALSQGAPARRGPRLAGYVLLAGLLLFSGTLYLMALSGARALAALAPLGGALLIAGWLMLGLDLWRARGR